MVGDEITVDIVVAVTVLSVGFLVFVGWTIKMVGDEITVDTVVAVTVLSVGLPMSCRLYDNLRMCLDSELSSYL